MKGKRKVYTESDIGNCLLAFKSWSGTKQQFCKHYGISGSTLYRWLEREVPNSDCRAKEIQPTTASFIEIPATVPSSGQEVNSSIEVHLPNGIYIKCCKRSDPVMVARLCKSLEGTDVFT